MPLQAVAPFQKSPQVQDVFTLEEAFEEADRLRSCTRTKRIEQKNDMMAWEIVRATAVARYLQLLMDGAQKMAASATAAFNFYFKQGNNSFKSRSIRNWAEYLIKTGAFPQYKQGQHKKTHSIIVEETVQAQLRTALRGMTDENRVPKNFQV